MTTLRHLLHRIAATLRRRRADAELEREIQAHLRLLEDRFLAEGMSAAEARFAARRAFGNLAHTKELQRDTRSFGWLTGWALEFRLGIRMLLRYPGLTVIGGLAMALAIVVGASVFEVVQRAMSASLPLPDGEGIIGLTYWDQKDNVRKSANAYDFSRWRNELTSLEDVGAFRLVQRNLAPEGGVAEPVTVAQISPSAFRVTKIPPMLGRALVESDEDPAAPGVVVLGHALWKSRFGADPAVVGRPVRLGTHRAIIAGVMPEGYAFPVDDQIWMPLRPAELSREPGAVSFASLGAWLAVGHCWRRSLRLR